MLLLPVLTDPHQRAPDQKETSKNRTHLHRFDSGDPETYRACSSGGGRDRDDGGGGASSRDRGDEGAGPVAMEGAGPAAVVGAGTGTMEGAGTGVEQGDGGGGVEQGDGRGGAYGVKISAPQSSDQDINLV